MFNDELSHYGTPHEGRTPHSGRYEWGSGENPFQRSGSFLADYEEAKRKGWTDKQFYEDRQMTASEFRMRRSNDRQAARNWYITRARALHEKGWSNTAIARELLGDPSKESRVRGYLKEGAKNSARRNTNLANMLEKEIKEKGCIDVGKEVNRELTASGELGNVSETRLTAALTELKDRGYEVFNIWVPQITNPDQKTTVKVAALPGTTPHELYKDLSKVKPITNYTTDNGETFNTIKRPTSLDSKRIYVRYAEDGGTDKDGTIELRRNVDDISLGSSLYAQVRIAVDGTHYMKGMAHYSDDIPKGYDIVFNTNKKKGTPMMDPNPDAKQVLKNLKSDPDNPFGALIKAGGQREYTDKDGKKKLSPVNILREEGDWENYSKTLSSQFLSKQNLDLIKNQLNLTYAENKEEFEKLKRLNNPAVKQKLLQTFAEQCDSAAVDLKATALPRQASKVLLPLPTLKENEIYAPTYKNGEHVVLIRYPHAGTFEIPELIVNNKNKEGERNITKNAIDAVGIHPKAAAQLSGADFDGDHVVVIPVNNKTKIDVSKPLEGLKNFDPKDAYQYTETKTTRELNKKTGKYEDVTHYYRNGVEFKPIKEQYKQIQMGVISNLISDMTLIGAEEKELERAVKHSMVIIDSEKHKLDYHQSAIDNNIKALHQKYQGKAQGGAATLISRAGSPTDIPKRRKKNAPDPETGKWIYEETGQTYPSGAPKMETVEKMKLTDDAFTLSSGNKKEALYAEYANRMKAMANEARKEAYAIKPVPVSKSSAQVYEKEVKSLEAKLDTARRNAPKERQAELIANQVAHAKWDADPTLDKEHKQRIGQQELTKARALVGANKKDVMVDITPKEWEAIQAGSISTNKLRQILNNTDMDKVREYATPKDSRSISDVTKRQIEARLATGRYTIAEIAESAGVSPATVSNINKEMKGGN